MFLLYAHHCQAFSLTQWTLSALQGLHKCVSPYIDEEVEAWDDEYSCPRVGSYSQTMDLPHRYRWCCFPCLLHLPHLGPRFQLPEGSPDQVWEGTGRAWIRPGWRVPGPSLHTVSAPSCLCVRLGSGHADSWPSGKCTFLQFAQWQSSVLLDTVEVTYRHHLNQTINVNITRNRTFQNCMSAERTQWEEDNITSVASLPEIHNLIYSREHQKNLRHFTP